MKRLTQITIEDRYSKRNIRKKVLKELMDIEPDGAFGTKILDAANRIHKYMEGSYYKRKENRIMHLIETDFNPLNFICEALIIVLPNQNYMTIQSVCGQLSRFLKYSNIFDGIETAGELIACCAEADLFDVMLPSASSTGSALIKNTHTLSPELMQYITNTKYLPPMVCEPMLIKDNWDCAYITQEDPVMLKGKTHDGKLPLDVINIRNNIALSLDVKMLEEEEELPKKPLETMEQEENFRRMRDASTHVYEELLEHGNKFYLTHRVDERLRMYCQGYHCSYQSSKFKRSIINLHKKEVING